MKKRIAVLLLGMAFVGPWAGAQQFNVIINNQWAMHYAEARNQPHVVFSTSFQTQVGHGFVSPWLGQPPFCLVIGEERSFFNTQARIITPDDQKRNPPGTLLFSLPRNLQAAAHVLQASGWRFYYSLGGYHVTLLIENICMEPTQIVCCKGYMVVTADPDLVLSSGPRSELTDWHVEQVERLAGLRDRGILTEDEFAREKERILNNR